MGISQSDSETEEPIAHLTRSRISQPTSATQEIFAFLTLIPHLPPQSFPPGLRWTRGTQPLLMKFLNY